MPILCPQRLEVNCQADSPSSVHLCSLSLKLWYPDLWCCRRVGCRNVKVESELVALQIVNVPTFARPLCAFLVAGDGEPI